VLKTFKIVAKRALIILCSNLDICAFCTPTSSPSCSCVSLKFIRRVTQIEQATNANDLRALKSLHFEKLSGKLENRYSIRINIAFRIIFRIEKDGNDIRLEVIGIEELNNHYS
jgi:proteic killer suppression protein